MPFIRFLFSSRAAQTAAGDALRVETSGPRQPSWTRLRARRLSRHRVALKARQRRLVTCKRRSGGSGPNRGETVRRSLRNLQIETVKYRLPGDIVRKKSGVPGSDRAGAYDKHQQAACGCDSNGNKRCGEAGKDTAPKRVELVVTVLRLRTVRRGGERRRAKYPSAMCESPDDESSYALRRWQMRSRNKTINIVPLQVNLHLKPHGMIAQVEPRNVDGHLGDAYPTAFDDRSRAQRAQVLDSGGQGWGEGGPMRSRAAWGLAWPRVGPKFPAGPSPGTPRVRADSGRIQRSRRRFRAASIGGIVVVPLRNQEFLLARQLRLRDC